MSTTTEIRTPVPAGTWQLDPVHSSVGFELAYMGGSFRGRFRDVAAVLTATARPRSPARRR
jgi:polyisoprenoid-binding protein YceI